MRTLPSVEISMKAFSSAEAKSRLSFSAALVAPPNAASAKPAPVTLMNDRRLKPDRPALARAVMASISKDRFMRFLHHGAARKGDGAGGVVHGLSDSPVSTAPAVVTAQRFVDLGIVGIRRRGEQRRRAHDLPRLAVATLRDVAIDPRLLQWVKDIAVRQSFDGRDGSTTERADGIRTGANGLAVDVHGTSPAKRDSAAEFGPDQPK